MPKLILCLLLPMVILLLACHKSSPSSFIHSPSPENSTIRGRVVDDAGARVCKSIVRLESREKSTKRETKTDSGGWFVFSQLAAGTDYQVVVEEQGFVPTGIKDIVLPYNSSVTIDIVVHTCNSIPIVPGPARMIDYKRAGGGMIAESQEMVPSVRLSIE